MGIKGIGEVGIVGVAAVVAMPYLTQRANLLEVCQSHLINYYRY